jgi:hypothetical protein
VNAQIRLSACVVLLSWAAVVTAAPGWRHTSERGFFVINLKPLSDKISVGKFQDWELRVQDANGSDVHPARIALAGGMVAHGHGLPTQPQVTEYLGDGRYRIEGMKFNMMGDWVLVISIVTPTEQDRVNLNISLDY